MNTKVGASISVPRVRSSDEADNEADASVVSTVRTSHAVVEVAVGTSVEATIVVTPVRTLDALVFEVVAVTNVGVRCLVGTDSKMQVQF